MQRKAFSLPASSVNIGTASTPRQRLRVRPGWAVGSVLLLIFSLPLAFWQAPFPHPGQPFGERSLLETLWYPVEVNGPARMPSAPALMRAVAVAADRAWAVGAGGTILETTDGGQGWGAQTSGTRADLWSVRFQADGQRGWAAGTGGTILVTADGGGSWAKQTSGTQAYLTSLQFSADGQRGWAVGTDGTILATTNGGRSWAAQTSGKPRADLYSVRFQADGQHGWAVGTGARSW